MQIALKTLALSSIAIFATAAFAATKARVDVPFSFTAEGQTYPAGSYTLVLGANESLVTLENQNDASKHIALIVGPTDPASTPAVVKFDHVGEDYALRTIQLGNHVTPNLDRTRKGGVAATTTISGARNALSRSRSRLSAPICGCVRRSCSASSAPKRSRASPRTTTKRHGRSRP